MSALRLDPLFAYRPGYAAALADVWAAVWEQDVVDASTLELCRLRIGQLVGAQPHAEHVPAEVLDALPRWPDHPGFTPRDRVALAFAEQLLFDVSALDDEQAADVLREYGEAGLLVLAYACGLFETAQRAEVAAAVLFG
jgi:alkylhydroperoxidase family enzyme